MNNLLQTSTQRPKTRETGILLREKMSLKCLTIRILPLVSLSCSSFCTQESCTGTSESTQRLNSLMAHSLTVRLKDEAITTWAHEASQSTNSELLEMRTTQKTNTTNHPRTVVEIMELHSLLCYRTKISLEVVEEEFIARRIALRRLSSVPAVDNQLVPKMSLLQPFQHLLLSSSTSLLNHHNRCSRERQTEVPTTHPQHLAKTVYWPPKDLTNYMRRC